MTRAETTLQGRALGAVDRFSLDFPTSSPRAARPPPALRAPHPTPGRNPAGHPPLGKYKGKRQSS